MKRTTATIIAGVFIGGCAAPQLPQNVALSSDGKFVDRMTFETKTEQPAPAVYGHLKTCIAEHVSNEGVTLSDSSSSFVGPATGNYYRVDSAQTTQGGQAVQMIDDSTRTVIAKGSLPFSAMPLVDNYMRFTMRATAEDSGLKIALSQITEAQASTGAFPNTGFSPLGTFAGSGADNAYAAANQLVATIASCVDQK